MIMGLNNGFLRIRLRLFGCLSCELRDRATHDPGFRGEAAGPRAAPDGGTAGRDGPGGLQRTVKIVYTKVWRLPDGDYRDRLGPLTVPARPRFGH